MIALASVVVNDVQDHFNLGGMKLAHKVAELAVLFARRLIDRVGMMRSEEAERHVSPVVVVARIKLKHRH